MVSSNRNKWLIAVPFSVFFTLVLPGLVVSDLLWYIRHWTDSLFMFLSFSIWLIATAFVDVTRPRGPRDPANSLIPLGLILVPPIAVWDRAHWIASTMPLTLQWVGVLISIIAFILGVTARRSLGRAYVPRSSHVKEGELVRQGLYRWIRHPLYLATILWIIGWPLIEGSFVASVIANLLILPAIFRRIEKEEGELIAVYGETYVAYQQSTWRLVPFVY